MHVKTKSAWATNSAMGGGAVRSILEFLAAAFWQRWRFRGRSEPVKARFSVQTPRAVAAVVARHPSVTLTDSAAATRRNFDRFSLDIAYLATKRPQAARF